MGSLSRKGWIAVLIYLVRTLGLRCAEPSGVMHCSSNQVAVRIPLQPPAFFVAEVAEGKDGFALLMYNSVLKTIADEKPFEVRSS